MNTVMSARMSKVMQWMTKRCCDQTGKPNFERMQDFMERCGKHGFSDEEVSTMHQFCADEDKADFDKMMAFMEKCGCFPPPLTESDTT